MDRRRKQFYSTLFSVSLALICYLLVLAISHDFQKTWDLTTEKRHSLSEKTIDFMGTLNQKVKLYAFVDPRGDSSVIETMLDRYQKLSPRFFEFEIVDLQKNPTLSERLQVRSYGQGVLEKVEELLEGEIPRRERVGKFDEASITNGLTKLLRNEEKSVYFLVGHGERRPDQNSDQEMSHLRESLQNEGYLAKPLKLAETGEIPKDATMLVIAGPTGELLDSEKALLDSYLKNYGKLFFMADLRTPESYNEWLGQYGLKMGDSVIVDESSQQVKAEPVTPLGLKYSPDHPITKGFLSYTAFRLARPLEVGESQVEGLSGNTTALVNTNDSAYLLPLKEILSGKGVEFNAAGQTPKSYVLAASGKYTAVGTDEPEPSPSPDAGPKAAPPSARIVLASSAETFSNSWLGLASNRDFVLNAFNWLAETENQITVRPKDPKIKPISLSRQSQLWLFFTFCGLIPFLSTLTGLLISYYRRKGTRL